MQTLELTLTYSQSLYEEFTRHYKRVPARREPWETTSNYGDGQATMAGSDVVLDADSLVVTLLDFYFDDIGYELPSTMSLPVEGTEQKALASIQCIEFENGTPVRAFYALELQ